jgi:hypothetical protein
MLKYELRFRMLRLLQEEDHAEALIQSVDEGRRWGSRQNRQAMATARRIEQHAEVLERLMPSVSLGIALGWSPWSLRPMTVLEYAPDEAGGPCLLIAVYSATTRGNDLIKELRHQIDRQGMAAIPSSPDAHRIELTFALVHSADALPEALAPLEFTPRQTPCVAIRLPLPLPPPESIGREFDAVVREERRWHRLLVGSDEHNQDNAVALRTWGVALMMNAGVPFGQAMRQVCDAGEPHLSEVSQSKFGEDRRRLAERVPEARAMLLQPERDRTGCNP